MAVIRDVMPAFELVQPNSIADPQKVLDAAGRGRDERVWVQGYGRVLFSVSLSRNMSFRALQFSCKFVESRARKAYDAQARTPNRKFLFIVHAPRS